MFGVGTYCTVRKPRAYGYRPAFLTLSYTEYKVLVPVPVLLTHCCPRRPRTEPGYRIRAWFAPRSHLELVCTLCADDDALLPQVITPPALTWLTTTQPRAGPTFSLYGMRGNSLFLSGLPVTDVIGRCD